MTKKKTPPVELACFAITNMGPDRYRVAITVDTDEANLQDALDAFTIAYRPPQKVRVVSPRRKGKRR